MSGYNPTYILGSQGALAPNVLDVQGMSPRLDGALRMMKDGMQG